MKLPLFETFACGCLVSSAEAALRGGRNLQSLTRLVLIDAATDQPITDIADGAVISVPNGASLNVQAITSAPGSYKVQFKYNGADFRTEGKAPYAFCGDKGGNYAACNELVPGIHTITAEIISDGSPISSLTVDFELTYGGTTPVAPPPPPAPVAPVAPVAPPPSPVAPPSVGGLPWVETFSFPDGVTSDDGDTSWTATRANGNFFVQDKALRVNDKGSEAVFESGVIDIMGTAVDVSLDMYSVGPLESNQDYVRLYVKVDGGPEVFVGEKVGVQTATTISGSDITGDKLVLVIRAFVSFNNEEYFIDDVSVSPSSPTAPVAPPPTPAPVASPPTTPFNVDGTWKLFNNQPYAKRHEACFVMVGDRAYLMGGRETTDVDIYNPATGKWTKGAKSPQKLHHLQCVNMNGKVYFPAAWQGGFPEEDTVDKMYIYDTTTDKWSSENAMPQYRRRGSAAIVADGNKIWVSHGNVGGHEKNDFATSFGWIDYYDTATKTWVMGDKAGFPDAPNPRDHTGGALINGRICVAGGRRGGEVNWPAVAPTDCFDPAKKKWTVEADIPVPRSGSSYGTTCDGRLVIASGERPGTKRVDVFDGTKWETFADELATSRHGSGLAVDCARNKIYLAGGTKNGGSANNLDTMEIYTPA